MKKIYNRIEKIGYYTAVLQRAYYTDTVSNELIEKALKRLEYLTSDKYQDWDDRIAGLDLVDRAKKAASSR